MTPDSIQTTGQLIRFINNAFQNAGFSRAVIALSGGVDSATSCALAVKALGKENVYPLLLPYGELNTQGTADARLVIDALQIPQMNVTEIDIKPPVDTILREIPSEVEGESRSLEDRSRQARTISLNHVRKGNMMARMRMIVLFDQAKARDALVIGTENKSEHLLGYFTRFGDSASDIEPLQNMYKTQVYELAKALGIPGPILTKKPTAGLWEGQTDEGDFGFTYKEADQILALLYDEKKPVEEVVAQGFAKEIVEKVRARVDQNSFKHHLPIIPQ